MKRIQSQKRPSLNDPEWWTSIAVDLVTINLGSLAKNLSKLLVTDGMSISKELLVLYEAAFSACLKETSISVDLPAEVLDDVDVLAFDPSFPTNFVLFTRLIEELDKVCEEQDANDMQDEFRDSVRSSFGGAINLIRQTRSEEFRHLNRFIELIENGYETPQGQLAEHTNNILYKLSQEPLPIDPSVTLWEIYITPSAKYEGPAVRHRSDLFGPESEFAGNIIESLLSSIDKSTDPIVVHGQPGHGKTSTMRMLTHAVCARERLTDPGEKTNVLMYEFKNLGPLNENELKVLKSVTPFIQDKRFFEGQKTLLILDGLDERQITDGSDMALREFVRRMFDLSVELNKGPNKLGILPRRAKQTKFNLVMTGRSQFVNQIKSAFNSDYHYYEIQDFSRAQVQLWLAKYCSHKRLPQALSYDDFKSKGLGDLIHQPILLTISSLMLVDDKGSSLLSNIDDAAFSRGEIYRAIVEWTYYKKWQSQPNRSQLPSEKAYHKFLETTAFTLFRHGKESIKVSGLLDQLNQNQKLYQLDDFEFSDSDRVEEVFKNLSVSFFFKGIEESSFSFIHKSIKDYLVSLCIFNLLLETVEIFRDNRIEKSCDDIANDVYRILGKSALSREDNLGFLKDIASSCPTEAKVLFRPLLEFFKLAKDHRYLISCESGLNDDPIATEANVLSGLLYFITELPSTFDRGVDVALRGGRISPFDGTHDFDRFLSLLKATGSNRVAFDLTYIDLASMTVTDVDLRSSMFRGGRLVGSELSNVDLSGMDLRGIDLSSSTLSRVKLNSTDLRGANLAGAKLRNVELIGSRLDDSNLAGLTCEYSKFDSSSMRNIDWTDSHTRYCSLQNVDIRDSKLMKSTVVHSNIRGASIYGSNLSGSELRHVQLNNTVIEKSDLRKVEISYADVSDLSFEEVELSKTVFVGVKGMPGNHSS